MSEKASTNLSTDITNLTTQLFLSQSPSGGNCDVIIIPNGNWSHIVDD